MKLSNAAIAVAIAACAASVEADVWIIGDSTTSHYDYKTQWDANTDPTYRSYLLQNQLFAWGSFAKDFTTQTVWDIAKGGLSSRSWWWQWANSDCMWPSIRSSTVDSNTAGCAASLTGHCAAKVTGQPTICPRKARPNSGDTVIIQLGINDNSDWLTGTNPNKKIADINVNPHGLYKYRPSDYPTYSSAIIDANVTAILKSDDTDKGANGNYRAAPDYRIPGPLVMSNPKVPRIGLFDETILDFSTYMKKLVSSLVCSNNDALFMYPKTGMQAITANWNPPKLLSAVKDFDSSTFPCTYNGVKVVLMTDNLKAGQKTWAVVPWLERLNAIRNEFNAQPFSYKIPEIANGFQYQKNAVLGINQGEFQAFYFSHMFGDVKKDNTHPNYYGARLQAVANVCALKKVLGSDDIFTENTKITSTLCDQLASSSTSTSANAVLTNIKSILGFSGNVSVSYGGVNTFGFARNSAWSVPTYE